MEKPYHIPTVYCGACHSTLVSEVTHGKNKRATFTCFNQLCKQYKMRIDIDLPELKVIDV